MGPITKNGIHPITKTAVHDVGTHGAARAAKPAASQVPAAGAKTEHDGAKKKPGEYGNGTVAGTPETPGSRGTSSEEQKGKGKSFAERMYPSVKGLRGAAT